MITTHQIRHKDMPFKSTFFGFTSVQDFITSLIGFNYGIIHSAIIAFFSLLTIFIGTYIWDSPEAVYTLWSLMGFDYFTGISKSIKNGSFVSFKLWRMPIYFVMTTLLLSLSFWMAKATVVFVLLPTIVMSGFMSVFFVSGLENLGELGWLPKPMITVLKNRFGLKALIEKYNKMEDGGIKTPEEEISE